MTIAFQSYTADTAPEASKPLLAGVKAQFGFIPNLQSIMAESPELLAAHNALWAEFARTTLTRHEQQVVFMTAIYENNCHYCMAGHTTMARMQKLGEDVIQALRDGGTIADPKLEALHRFTTLVVRDRGFVSDEEVQAFLDAGYTRRNVLEVVLGVSIKIQSNYVNHLVGTPLDPFMAGNEWTKPGARPAAA
jgi:AhpD family alkylhydroperoxidase